MFEATLAYEETKDRGDSRPIALPFMMSVTRDSLEKASGMPCARKPQGHDPKCGQL